MSEELHRLPAVELARLDLPDAAKAVLARGLPIEVAISDLMPTVFSSALGDGAVRATSTDASAGGYVIGSIKDTFEPRVDLATFVLERGTGHVLLLDQSADREAGFVNSDIGSFLSCLDELLDIMAEARRFPGDDEAGERLSAALRSRIASVDPLAIQKDGYWGMWVDDLLVG
ncbi:SUKH-4 family immunity protein [Micromonospora yasonensis]|uniref:SUKH-4 family immunity protein n=1 Tax=Micromonospora yasonensis TaxID=1128667 RepID=UPI0022329591|nr:SUKH-4 family immunity protein [Micromonospora yasonensis]MCW3838589.1 SUKH-4 family immunity protein [Micromonospora yasonensis]